VGGNTWDEAARRHDDVYQAAVDGTAPA
jgi:hypothetical protein